MAAAEEAHRAHTGKESDPMNQPQAVRFFQVWDTYAKVVAANYMFHRELGEGIKIGAARAFFWRALSRFSTLAAATPRPSRHCSKDSR